MVRRYILAIIITFVPALTYAFDCTNWYLRGSTGLNFLSIPSIPEASMESKVGYALGGSIGYKFSRTFRLEGEFTYRHNSLDQLILKGDTANIEVELDGNVSSFAGMGNILFDMPFNRICVPYFGLGVGGYREWGRARIPILEGTPDDVRLKLKKEGAAYQVIVGLNILHCNRIDAGIEYHYFDSVIDSDSNHNHTLAITCRRTF